MHVSSKENLKNKQQVTLKEIITLSFPRPPFLNKSYFFRRLDFNFSFNSFVFLIICNTKKERKKLIKTEKGYIKSQ